MEPEFPRQPPNKVFFVDKTKWTREQHKIWHYLNTKQDSFYQVRFWPPWAQQNITFPHKNDSQMYNLFYFLLWNGVYPLTAMKWITMADVRNGEPVKGVYSNKELMDMDRVLVRHANGQLYLKSKKVFDMVANKPVTTQGHD